MFSYLHPSNHHFGRPHEIRDLEEFENSVVSELLALQRIQTHFCSPNCLYLNEMIESFHSTLIKYLKLFNTKIQDFTETPRRIKIMYAILASFNPLQQNPVPVSPVDIIAHIFVNNSLNWRIIQ